jgi:hypothetical protein
MLAHSFTARAASPPATREPLPDINDRLAPPETRIEVLDGKKIVTMPADPKHAIAHIEVAAVVKAHVAKGYTGAVDMLTRTSKTSDFAPDVSVFPSAPDPKTKRRRLEELAFEIASEQARKRILGANDAADLDRWLRRAAVVHKAGELFDPA